VTPLTLEPGGLIHPVILCGGSGTRLWPVSRQSFPKQFSRLVGEESLFQATARRLSGEGFANPVIVTSADFRFIVRDQLAGAGALVHAVAERDHAALDRHRDHGARVVLQLTQARIGALCQCRRNKQRQAEE